MGKKGQGLSINAIIIALIALTVLVVLIAIFTGAFGKIIPGFNDCENKGGKCSDPPSCDTDYSKNPAFTCEKSKICCFKTS